jgi:probable HAF family extracellular repeat protein
MHSSTQKSNPKQPRMAARRLRRAVLLAATLNAAAVTLAAPPRYTLKLIPPPERYEFSAPLGMSEAGEIVGYVGAEPYDPLSVGVRVSATGETAIVSDGSTTAQYAFGINASGLVVGESGLVPHLWESGGARTLERPEGYFSGAARAINDAGVIVGSAGDSDFTGPQHCLWPGAAERARILPGIFPESTTGSAWAINSSGQIAGVSGSLVGTFFAARWDAPDIEPIKIGPLPGAVNSEGLGINERGDVVGRSSFEDATTEAFFFDGILGELHPLGFLPGGEGWSWAQDVNDARQIVGHSRAADGRLHAVLWEDLAAHDLNDLLVASHPSVRYLMRAVAINSRGQIAVEAVLEGRSEDMPRRMALLTPAAATFSFRRLDCNGDGATAGVADAVAHLSANFVGGLTLPCRAACDVNGDGDISGVTDAVAALVVNFIGGVQVPAPYPGCGSASRPSDLELGCVQPPASCR